MTQQHPIIPPPELVRKWQQEANHNKAMFPQVAAKAAQWGADQELDACCEWLAAHSYLNVSELIRAARRPELPVSKEEALDLLDLIEVSDDSCTSWDFGTIRRALEQLND